MSWPKCAATIRRSCFQSTPIPPTPSTIADHLKKLDDFNLLMIEQPLQNDDLDGPRAIAEDIEDAGSVSMKALSTTDRPSSPWNWTVVE